MSAGNDAATTDDGVPPLVDDVVGGFDVVEDVEAGPAAAVRDEDAGGAPVPENGADGAVLAAVVDLGERVAALAQREREHDERAAARERVVDHLRAEVDRLRDVERGGRLRPLVVDLQRLRADLLTEAARTVEDVRADRARAMLGFYADTVAQVLERAGAVPSTPRVGDAFTAGTHRVVRAVDVAGPEEHGVVVEVLGEGYVEVGHDRVLAAAPVVVGRFVEQEDRHV